MDRFGLRSLALEICAQEDSSVRRVERLVDEICGRPEFAGLESVTYRRNSRGEKLTALDPAYIHFEEKVKGVSRNADCSRKKRLPDFPSVTDPVVLHTAGQELNENK